MKARLGGFPQTLTLKKIACQLQVMLNAVLQQALHSLCCCARLPSQPCLEQESNATTHQLLAPSLETLTKGNRCLSVNVALLTFD